MNKKYEVIWSEAAEKDLTALLDYITADSPENALRIFKQIKQKTAGLNFFPERGRIVPELGDLGIRHYRELILSPWRFIYRISKTRVYLLSVLDSRQDIEEILFKRLIDARI